MAGHGARARVKQMKRLGTAILIGVLTFGGAGHLLPLAPSVFAQKKDDKPKKKDPPGPPVQREKKDKEKPPPPPSRKKS